MESAAPIEMPTPTEGGVGAEETRRKRRRATKSAKIEKVAIIKMYLGMEDALNECGDCPERLTVSLVVLYVHNLCVVVRVVLIE